MLSKARKELLKISLSVQTSSPEACEDNLYITPEVYRGSILLRGEQPSRRKPQHPVVYWRFVAELSEANMACEKLLREVTDKSACRDQGVWRSQTRRGLCRVNSRFNKLEHSKLAVLTLFLGLKPSLTCISQPQVGVIFFCLLWGFRMWLSCLKYKVALVKALDWFIKYEVTCIRKGDVRQGITV